MAGMPGIFLLQHLFSELFLYSCFWQFLKFLPPTTVDCKENNPLQGRGIPAFGYYILLDQ